MGLTKTKNKYQKFLYKHTSTSRYVYKAFHA